VGTSTLALNVGVVLAQELARGKRVIWPICDPAWRRWAFNWTCTAVGWPLLTSRREHSAEIVEAHLVEYQTGLRV